MTKYYRLLTALAVVVAFCNSAWAQYPPRIDSIVESKKEFLCEKAQPVDLFKAAGMYISPDKGYWGDSYGVPYNGANLTKPGLVNDKERLLTNGNIFTPLGDSSRLYNFYFYFTSATDYCGVGRGTVYHLKIDIAIDACFRRFEDGDGLPDIFYYCYGTFEKMHTTPPTHINYNREVVDRTTANGMQMPLTDLLFSGLSNTTAWKVDSIATNDWLPIEVYADSLYNPSRRRCDANNNCDGKYMVNLVPDNQDQNSVIDTFYLQIRKTVNGVPNVPFRHRLIVEVYRQSHIQVYYNPDVLTDKLREYEIDDEVSITVDGLDNNDILDFYKFYMNRKDLNKYYLNGDSTQKEIVIPALAFSGVEDFIEIVVTDQNQCLVRHSDNVIVRVPFPTAFTPDGDGINDVFLGGEKFRNREFYLEIFNRWGNRLYAGQSGWDGKYRGKDVPAATYNYVVKIKDSTGAVKEFKSTVTLMRK
ncbi:MAG: gliding motility-associated C-terminal domain-containing protein [Prevotellaceae bacterium]|nr:gliding motility-associated C-terminal domain-containing protein [Prevotellaceae bacterium]